MKFKLVKEVDNPVSAYGCEGISTGDEIDLEGHFAGKAAKNPDFEAVVDGDEDPDQ